MSDNLNDGDSHFTESTRKETPLLPEKMKKSDIDLKKFREKKQNPISNAIEVTDEIRANLIAHFQATFGNQNFNDVILENFEGKNRNLDEILKKYTVKLNLPIYVTLSHSLPQKVQGNRKLTEKDVFDIAEGVMTDGYQAQLANLNKSLGIIDGQNRGAGFDHLQSNLDVIVPYYFFITPDAYKHEMIALNRTGSTWKKNNYLEHHTESDDPIVKENYTRMNNIVNEFNVTQSSFIRLINTRKKGWGNKFELGQVIFTEEQEQKIRNLLRKTKILHGYLTGHKQDKQSSDGRIARKKQKVINKSWIEGVRAYDSTKNSNFKLLLNKIQHSKIDLVVEGKKRKLGSSEKVLEWLLEICPINKK